MNPTLLDKRKLFLRKKLRQSLAGLPVSQIKTKSAKIARKVLAQTYFQTAKNILIYVALPREVQTQELILKAMALKKNIFVPCINQKTLRMEIYQVKDWKKDLCCGSYGILEPRSIKKRKGNPKKMDLMVLPGLGFDKKGGRLGRGAGYFDRFLAKAGKVKKIGIAFREQIVKKIPMAAHDVRIDGVITD